jgi:hypothetical protein
LFQLGTKYQLPVAPAIEKKGHMTLSPVLLPAAVLISVGMVTAVANSHFQSLKAANEQAARDAAVDGCMQNARYNWQEKNRQDATLLNTTDEPNRFWYKLCMQDKGYEVRIEI